MMSYAGCWGQWLTLCLSLATASHLSTDLCQFFYLYCFFLMHNPSINLRQASGANSAALSWEARSSWLAGQPTRRLWLTSCERRSRHFLCEPLYWSDPCGQGSQLLSWSHATRTKERWSWSELCSWSSLYVWRLQLSHVYEPRTAQNLFWPVHCKWKWRVVIGRRRGFKKET